MALKTALKTSLFKKIDGRVLIVEYLTMVFTVLSQIDTSDWSAKNWTLFFGVSIVPVIAVLFNIPTGSNIAFFSGIFKKFIDVIFSKDLTNEQKLKILENEIIIDVNEWNKINEQAKLEVNNNTTNTPPIAKPVTSTTEPK